MSNSEDTKTSEKNTGNLKSAKPAVTSCALVFFLTMSFIIGGLLGGIGGGGLVLWAVGRQISLYQPPTVATVPSDTPTPSLTPTPTLPSPTKTPAQVHVTHTPTPSIADGVDLVLPAVVTIVNQHDDISQGGVPQETRIRGSGTIVDARGYIVTNYHVVEGCQNLTVILGSGEVLPARLVAIDAEKDMALVHVDGSDLTVAVWGDSTQVRPGEWAIAIGSALGDFPNSVTVGVISGLDRSLELDGDVIVGGLIQTDAAINKGNSGGPLVNQKGEVVGINTFIIREGQEIGVAEGISFAIPSAVARQLIDAWIAADSAIH